LPCRFAAPVDRRTGLVWSAQVSA